MRKTAIRLHSNLQLVHKVALKHGNRSQPFTDKGKLSQRLTHFLRISTICAENRVFPEIAIPTAEDRQSCKFCFYPRTFISIGLTPGPDILFYRVRYFLIHRRCLACLTRFGGFKKLPLTRRLWGPRDFGNLEETPIGRREFLTYEKPKNWRKYYGYCSTLKLTENKERERERSRAEMEGESLGAERQSGMEAIPAVLKIHPSPLYFPFRSRGSPTVAPLG